MSDISSSGRYYGGTLMADGRPMPAGLRQGQAAIEGQARGLLASEKKALESVRKSDAKKRCQHCRERFVHQRSTARFCSKSCRQRNNYHRGKARAEQAAAAAAEMARNEWYTPAVIIEAVRRVLGDIDLDPASCPEADRIVRAKAIYTVADNGLTQPWAGRIWLNPPL